MSDFPDAPRSKEHFAQSQGELFPARLDSVSETARAELENNNALDQAQDAHIRLWQAEEQKLAHRQDSIPEFDLGARAHRNLARDHDERSFIWRERGTALEQHHAERQAIIRESGHTLSSEFQSRPERQTPYLASHGSGRSHGRKR
jgi:hypothetical protein